MSFGSRLRELRIDKQITQELLSRELKISNNAISQYETDKRFPDERTLIEICKFYDVSCDYLLGLTDAKHSPLTIEEAQNRMFSQRQFKAYKQLLDTIQYKND